MRRVLHQSVDTRQLNIRHENICTQIYFVPFSHGHPTLGIYTVFLPDRGGDWWRLNAMGTAPVRWRTTECPASPRWWAESQRCTEEQLLSMRRSAVRECKVRGNIDSVQNPVSLRWLAEIHRYTWERLAIMSGITKTRSRTTSIYSLVCCVWRRKKMFDK